MSGAEEFEGGVGAEVAEAADDENEGWEEIEGVRLWDGP